MNIYKSFNKSFIIIVGVNPPTEIMHNTFLPAMRGLVTHKLRNLGYSQSKIAALLGITQASVSMYLNHNIIIYKEKLRTIGISDLDSDRYVGMLSEDVIRGHVEGIYTLLSIWRNILSSGLICSVHKKLDSIVEDCDVCMRLYNSIENNFEKAEVLREVERAAKIVEDSHRFQHIMPEVSVNIVMAIQNAQTEDDVAAFPGRIIKVHGQAKHILPAEFGVSRHTARMLLTATQYNSELRAAINIKYDKKIKDILSNMELNIIDISSNKYKVNLKGDVVVTAFKISLAANQNLLFNVVVDTGGKGLEPITYIFGKNATETAEIVLSIANNYTK